MSLTDEKHEAEVNERVGIPSDESESNRESRNLSDSLPRRSDNCNGNTEEAAADVRLSRPEAAGDDDGGHVEMDEETGNLSNLSQELLKLSKYGWYWGPISGDEADTKLQSEPDGAFLIRDSSDDR